MKTQATLPIGLPAVLVLILVAFLAILPASAQTLLAISSDWDSTSEENNPLDTIILSQGSDWAYTSDGARSIITALDNATSGDNRLILVQTDGVNEFTDTGTAADKGWVFEIELEILQGTSTSTIPFAFFGVRSENGAGKQCWVGLSETGGAGGTGRIGFVSSTAQFAGTPADLDVASLIGDGQYHNFKIHKYDLGGTTTVDVFMDGSLLLSRSYSTIGDDVDAGDIQGFASGTPVELSEVNIDFINFTLYDNLTDSIPDNGSDPMLISTIPADDADNVAPSADLVANFDETITFGTTGDVTIKNLTNPADIVISLGGSDPDGTLTLTSSTQLTIDPTAVLTTGDEYAVQIGSTVLEDALGNNFSGIADTSTWSFTVGAASTTVAYWQLDEASGDLVDVVGTRNLTGGSGLTYSQADLVDPVPNPDAGPFTSGSTSANPASILFPSVGIGPKTTDAAPFKLTTTNSFTFEGWLQTTATGGVIAGDRHQSTGYKGWYFPVLGTGQLRFYFTTGSAVQIDGPTVVNDGSPHHFAVVWDHSAGEMRLYVDGDLEGTASPTVGAYTQSAGFGIGARATSGDNVFNDTEFAGNLDELRLSNVALAPSEFLQPPIPDTVPPQIVTLSPADESTTATTDGNLVVTFDENIALKSGGTITITDTDDGSGTQVINLLDAARASVAGMVLTIDPLNDLEFDTNYEVTIGATAIEDQATSPNAYPGTTSGEWNFQTVSEVLPPAVLVDLNADGTARTATTAHFEAATGLAAGIFSGDTVTHFDLNGPNITSGTTILNATVDNITVLAESSQFTLAGDADGWFGGGSNNNLLEDGLFMRNDSANPSGTLTLSGSGLGLTPSRSYEFYLFAGRTQGHETTFTFAGTAIHTDPPVVGGDNTLGTALFTFETTGTAPSSLVVQWDALQSVTGNEDAAFAGFVLRDVGAAAPPANGFANWITGFGLAPGDQGFTDDPDGDGLASGVEAYFGTDPNGFDAGLVEVSKSGNVVTFQHPNPTTPLDDVTGSYQWSLDLQTWYDADGVDTDGSTTVNAVPSPDDPSANVTTVTATIGGTVPGKIFLRAVATQD